MTPRTIPILNAIGCLALTGLVVLQWRKERSTDQTVAGLRTELAASKDKAAEEGKRRAALERDIEVLKESIISTQHAAESAAKTLADKDADLARLQAEIRVAREQVTQWEAALKARDERIVLLDSNLAATRKLLDEAVAKLKAAGAR